MPPPGMFQVSASNCGVIITSSLLTRRPPPYHAILGYLGDYDHDIRPPFPCRAWGRAWDPWGHRTWASVKAETEIMAGASPGPSSPSCATSECSALQWLGL